MHAEITPASLVRRAEVVISSDLDEETVMMDIEKGLYYGLNNVGSRIWTLIERPVGFSELCDVLAGEYEDVSREQVEKEVLLFLQELVKRNIVEVSQEADRRVK